jgi:hypothetical protein
VAGELDPITIVVCDDAVTLVPPLLLLVARDDAPAGVLLRPLPPRGLPAPPAPLVGLY